MNQKPENKIKIRNESVRKCMREREREVELEALIQLFIKC